ncbi:nucleotide-binding alpha-beta plait domain-containing protein [Tanacetum coccineum]
MDSGDDDLKFRIIFSGDGAGKLRERVSDKLKEFMGEYTDDTLVEYVIVLLKNGRRKEEARNELNVFLGDDSDSFVSWLWDHLRSNKPKESRPDELANEKPKESFLNLHNESEQIKSDKFSKSRRSKDWKSTIRDPDEPPPLRSAVIANIHADDISYMRRSPSPQPVIQRKRDRNAEGGQIYERLQPDERSQLKIDLGIKTKTQLMAEKSVFKILLMTIIAATIFLGGPLLSSNTSNSFKSRNGSSSNLKELDPLIFLDALVEVLADENRLHAKAALNALNVFCIFGITHVPRQKYWPVMPVEHIASCFCSCFVTASEIFLRFGHQIHPVVSRLCAFIEGTSPSMLADCLGVDPSKFQSKSSEVANNDHSGSVIVVADDGCSGTFDCPSIISYIRTVALETSTDVQDQSPNTSFWNKLCCLKCQVEVPPVSVANHVKKRAELFISTNYKGLMTCDDETCDYTTRSLNLRVIGDSQRGTFILTSILRQMCTSSSLFSDSNRCMDKVEANFRNSVEKEVARITPQKIKAKKPTWKLGSSFSLKKPVKILLKVLIDDDIDLIHEDKRVRSLTLDDKLWESYVITLFQEMALLIQFGRNCCSQKVPIRRNLFQHGKKPRSKLQYLLIICTSEDIITELK